ncbi:MAG: ComF family protein [Phycisphaerales bacterium]
MLSQLEDALLEPEHLSLARRAMRTGWLPDPPHLYCHRCGETVGPHEGDGRACRSCADRKLRYTCFYRLGTLDAELRAWIYEIKFARGHRMARSLGALLATRIAAGSPPPNRRFIVVPVPTTHRRRIARGIDHSAHIAAGIAEQLESPVVRLLARRHTRPQRGLPRSARADNIRGAIKTRNNIAALGSSASNPPCKESPAPIILLVDDVRTTGATLHACASAITRSFARSAPPEIWAACLAVAEPGRD